MQQNIANYESNLVKYLHYTTEGIYGNYVMSVVARPFHICSGGSSHTQHIHACNRLTLTLTSYLATILLWQSLPLSHYEAIHKATSDIFHAKKSLSFFSNVRQYHTGILYQKRGFFAIIALQYVYIDIAAMCKLLMINERKKYIIKYTFQMKMIK